MTDYQFAIACVSGIATVAGLVFAVGRFLLKGASMLGTAVAEPIRDAMKDARDTGRQFAEHRRDIDDLKANQAHIETLIEKIFSRIDDLFKLVAGGK